MLKFLWFYKENGIPQRPEYAKTLGFIKKIAILECENDDSDNDNVEKASII